MLTVCGCVTGRIEGVWEAQIDAGGTPCIAALHLKADGTWHSTLTELNGTNATATGMKGKWSSSESHIILDKGDRNQQQLKRRDKNTLSGVHDGKPVIMKRKR
jgi:hypothetical protein